MGKRNQISIEADYSQLPQDEAAKLFLERNSPATVRREARATSAKLEHIAASASSAAEKIKRSLCIAGVGIALVMLPGCAGSGGGEQVDVVGSSAPASDGVGGCKDGMCRAR